VGYKEKVKGRRNHFMSGEKADNGSWVKVKVKV
jgi:hypothetical protein